MTETTSPLIDAARGFAPELARRSSEIEAARRIPEGLARELGRAGLYRMLVPRALGGEEVDPIVFATVLEELSRGDAAVGWCTMTAATTGLLLAYLPDEGARAIVAEEPDSPLAGVFAPMGRARPAPGGYRLGGRWSFASGCENARFCMGGGLVIDGDAPRTTAGGAPEVRSFFVRAEATRVVDTWNVSGLRGTGSHDLVVEDAFVPEAHTTCIFGDRVRHEGTLYAFPVFGLLATGVAAVGLGIGRAAIDALTEVAKTKKSRGGKKTMAEQELVQVRIATAEAELRAGRSFLLETLAQAWSRAESAGRVGDDDRALLRLAATHAARASVRAVDAMYELGGGAAIYAESPLQRHFRDVHVMTQHIMVGEQTLKPVGRILLGLPTDTTQL